MVIHGINDKVDLSVAPMASEDVQNRLQALHEVDDKIIQLLKVASDAVSCLKEGKQQSSGPSVASATEESKQQFEKNTKQYFSLLESISVGLRNEVRLLHQQSKEKVLPLSLAAKADRIGKQKEHQIWSTVDHLLGIQNDNDDKESHNVSGTNENDNDTHNADANGEGDDKIQNIRVDGGNENDDDNDVDMTNPDETNTNETDKTLQNSINPDDSTTTNNNNDDETTNSNYGKTNDNGASTENAMEL